MQTSKDAFRSLLVDGNVKKKDSGFEFMVLHLLAPAFEQSVSKKVKLQVDVVEIIKSGGPCSEAQAQVPKWDFYIPVDDDTAEDMQFLDPFRHEKLYSLMKRRLFVFYFFGFVFFEVVLADEVLLLFVPSLSPV